MQGPADDEARCMTMLTMVEIEWRRGAYIYLYHNPTSSNKHLQIDQLTLAFVASWILRLSSSVLLPTEC
jgi:hypothetical protein